MEAGFPSLKGTFWLMFCSLGVMGDLNVLPTSIYKLLAVAVTSVDTRKDFSLASPLTDTGRDSKSLLFPENHN